MAKAQLSSDIVNAGIKQVTDQYIRIDWGNLIEGATRLDVVVAYAATWRNANWTHLERLAKRKGARMRFFVPDPDDAETMRNLAVRFSKTEDEVRGLIREAIRDYASLDTPGGADLQVWVRPGDVLFSSYRFDGRVVLTLYSHSRERRSLVPAFVIEGGDLWKYVYEETSAILKQSRRVFPTPTGGHAT